MHKKTLWEYKNKCFDKSREKYARSFAKIEGGVEVR
jgi:hypothetical protein